ncbi:hypothetical protein BH18ACI2_BH18ACI2_03550 [soil metagenome]
MAHNLRHGLRCAAKRFPGEPARLYARKIRAVKRLTVEVGCGLGVERPPVVVLDLKTQGNALNLSL